MANAKDKRDCEFKILSKHFTKILRHGDSHEADGAVRLSHHVHDDSEIHAERNGNLERLEVPKIQEQDAQDTRHQAKHVAAVVACCRASPTRSGSRQRNEISSRFIMYVSGF